MASLAFVAIVVLFAATAVSTRSESTNGITSLSQNSQPRGRQAHFAPRTPQNEPVPDSSGIGSKPRPDGKVPTVQEMIDARTDVWGDASMKQRNGASYEFFQDLLPPLRWVNAEFRHYPIELSAPRAPQKVRLVSNGSAVNALANKPPMWYEQGVPVKFFVGDPAEPFGENLARLQTPTYVDGYLPVVTIRYECGTATYQEEVFAPVDEAPAAHGTAMVRFSIAKRDGKDGRVEARSIRRPPCKFRITTCSMNRANV